MCSFSLTSRVDSKVFDHFSNLVLHSMLSTAIFPFLSNGLVFRETAQKLKIRMWRITFEASKQNGQPSGRHT